MRVLILSASTYAEPHAVYPIGPDYVAGALAGRHELLLLDANDVTDREELARAVREFGPDVVGVSVRNIDNLEAGAVEFFIDGFRDLIATVRLGTTSPIVLGGAGFTLFPIQLIEAVGADYGIVGEGERLVDLLGALERGEKPVGLPGVVLPGGGAPIPEPWAGEARRIDPRSNRHTRYYLERGGILNLQTKRGCPYECIYCTYPRIEGRRLRRFDPAAVGRDARCLQDAGAKFLFVTDSVFNVDEDHSARVAEAIHEAGVTVPWGGFFTPRAAPEGYYAKLAACGCTHVEFGSESMSDRMLETYRKPFRAVDVARAHRTAVDAGLFVAHYFLFGGPGESPDTIAESLDAIERLSGGVFFFYCGIRIFPHTRLQEIALREGAVSPDDDLLAPVFYRSRAIDNIDIERMVTERARGRGNWIVGAAVERIVSVSRRLHALGHTGLLWERLTS